MPPLKSVAVIVNAGRIGLGLAALIAPRLVARILFRHASPSTVTVLRLFGGRDLALGLGTVLAATHESPGLRGWLEAGALADAADLAAMAGDRGRSVRPPMRALSSAAAFGATVIGLLGARSLDDRA